MTTPSHGLTHDHRTTLNAVSDSITMLPIPDAAELSTRLACLSHATTPDPSDVRTALTLAEGVQRALYRETAPDRWLDETDDLPADVRDGLIADLIDQRQGQAEQVGRAIDLLISALHHDAPHPRTEATTALA